GALAAPRYVAPAPVYVAPPSVYVEPAPVYGAPLRAYGYSPSDVDAVAYCSRRFRSYDPETGTYIAKGGVVRACP
ncbi:BA14K family protein, partial [Bosea sp. (in: a-proteobacteria)]